MTTKHEDSCKVFRKHQREARHNNGKFVKDERDPDSWHITGCCGGNCYVVMDIKFCPFCGGEL